VKAMLERLAGLHLRVQRLPRWKQIVLGLLILGVFFRFFNLDHKVYWGDEVFTSLRISGYSASEVVQEVYDGDRLTPVDLQRYQHPQPERGWDDTLRALLGSPEHTPLYYGMARLWVQGTETPQSTTPEIFRQQVQGAIAWIRSLSGLLSLLVFPTLYWLCLELFGRTRVAWTAIALVAVSPFHVLYAQEARGYSLYILTTLLSCAALLRALRRPSLESWFTYGIAAALGLYSFLFSGLVLVGQGLYVGLVGDRPKRAFWQYLGAAALALGLFSPWLWVVASRLDTLRNNVAHLNQVQSALVETWLLNLSRLFYDVNQGPSWFNPLTYGAAALAIYSLVFLCRHTPKRVWLLALTLIGTTGSALILSDLLLGGQRSAIARYPIPCYLGIQLAVAYCLTQKLTDLSLSLRQQAGWRRGVAFLVVAGVASCLISSQQVIWWNKGPSKTKRNPEVAAIVNRSDRPLVISDSPIEKVFSLAYLLEPQAQLQLVQDPAQLQLPSEAKDIFLYQPSDGLQAALSPLPNVSLEPTETPWLLRLVVPSGRDGSTETPASA